MKVLSETNQRKGFLVLSGAVAASVPLPPGFNSVTTILLFLFWLVFLPKKFDSERLKWIVLISSLVWIALIGMTYTQNVDEGLFRLQQKSLLLAYPLVFGTVAFAWKTERSGIAAVFVVVIFAACITALVRGIFYWAEQHSTAHLFSHGLAGQLDFYPYVLSLFSLASMIILVEARFNPGLLPNLFHRLPIFIMLVSFFSLFIFLLSVLQLMLAWLIAAAIYAFRLSKSRKTFFVWTTATVSAVILFIFLVPSLKTKVNDYFAGGQNTIPLDRDASLGFIPWNGIAMRKAVWTCALDEIKKNPMLGVGTGDGQDELQAAYEKRQFYFASRYNRFNTHNQYLQTVVNFGLIGLVVWLASFFFLFKMQRRHWLGQCLLGLCLFAMLTESMLETNKGILAMAFLLSVFSYPDKKNQPA